MVEPASPTLRLASGAELPAVGLGLWKPDPDDAPGLVQSALEVGYRHLDSACDYGNQAAVGRGIAEALRAGTCRRDELWIASKLWNTDHAREHVRPAAERSLRDLGVDRLDLAALNRDRRFNNPGVFCEQAFGTFFPIFE